MAGRRGGAPRVGLVIEGSHISWHLTCLFLVKIGILFNSLIDWRLNQLSSCVCYSRKQCGSLLLPEWDSHAWTSWLTPALTPLPRGAGTPRQNRLLPDLIPHPSTHHPSPCHTCTHTCTHVHVHTNYFLSPLWDYPTWFRNWTLFFLQNRALSSLQILSTLSLFHEPFLQ